MFLLNFDNPADMHSQEFSEEIYYDEDERINIQPVREHLEDVLHSRFYRNLAADYEIGSLDYIGVELRSKIDKDKDAFVYKYERYAKMLKRLGFSENSMIGGARISPERLK